MQFVPKALLNKLYNRSSLRNTAVGARFSVKNRLAPARLERVNRIALNGQTLQPEQIRVSVDGGEPVAIDRIDPGSPIEFPLGTLLTFGLSVAPLSDSEQSLVFDFEADPFGRLTLEVADRPRAPAHSPGAVPRNPEDDVLQKYTNRRVNTDAGTGLEYRKFQPIGEVVQGDPSGQ